MNAPPVRPRLDIHLAGERLPGTAAQSLVMAAVRQRLGAPSVAELTFAEPSGHWTGTATMGATLTLSVGGTALFSGDLVTIEHDCDASRGHVLRLRAHDVLHRLRKRQQVRGLADASVADLAATCVSGLGLAIDCPADSPRRPLRIQHDESDLDFLARQAGDAGLHPWLDGDTLRLLPAEGSGDPLVLRTGREIHSVRTATCADSLRTQTRTVAWDLRRMCRLVASEDADPALPSAATQAPAFAGLGGRSLLNRIADGAGEAALLARADLQRAAARSVTFEGVAEGDPALRPGRIVRLQPAVSAQCGDYAITTALHRFEPGGGYLVELDNQPPAPPPRATAPMFTVGRVIDVDDPDGAGRIRASLPLFDDVQTAWLPLLALAAGDGKGMVLLPEAGDDMLLLFPDGDPAHGIALGGLYGERSLPGDTQGRPRGFSFVSAGGQKVTLAGDRPALRLETSAGDVLELGPEGSSLTTRHDLLLAAPGKRLTLRAAAIDFEQG